MKNELLTGAEIRIAEKAVRDEGISEEALMERAGSGVVEVILKHFSPCPTVIFCGPGKNGGDGKVVGRLLKEKGWDWATSKFIRFNKKKAIRWTFVSKT